MACIGKVNPEIKRSGKKNFNSKAPLPKNIYGDKTVGEHVKRTHWFHYVFKYRLFLPFLMFTARFLGKYLIKEVPDEPHNEVLYAFNLAFDKSVVQWRRDIASKVESPNKDFRDLTPEELNKALNGHGAKALMTIKQLIITCGLTDSAYRNFGDILGHNFTRLMFERFKGQEKVEHAFYSSFEIYDVQYFSWWTTNRKGYGPLRMLRKAGETNGETFISEKKE